jgi:methyl-accepting chemotaxis protein
VHLIYNDNGEVPRTCGLAQGVNMKFLDSLKISTRIISLLIVLGALTVGIGWYASVPLKAADESYKVITNQSFPVGEKTASVLQGANQMTIAAYQALAYDQGTAEAKRATQDEVRAYELARDGLNDAVELDPALAARLTDSLEKVEELHTVMAEAVRYGQANHKAEALASIDKAAPLTAFISKDLQKLNKDNLAAALALSDALSAKAQRTVWWLLGLSIGGVIVTVGGSLVVTRVGITGPLDRLKAAMLKLASGNNQTDIPGADRGDEVGDMARVVLVFRDAAQKLEATAAAIAQSEAEQQLVVDVVAATLADLADGNISGAISTEFPIVFAALKNNFNAALVNLRSLIGGVAESAEGIRTGSDEIAQASEDLARRTESNAASLEETSAALVQIEHRLRATASASSGTVARADEAIASVGIGRTTAKAAMQAMTRVSASAKGIDNVIEGLDKIAFQTRVLAMNAAVEAGRAGDAGRGFAVVADLVSALAMRAEEEAKRARDQLTNTQSEITTAVDAVQRVDGAFGDISGNVDQVHKLLAGMAEDNLAQSAAITQITSAIGSMDRATQQNAAMVEETSAAARNLKVEVEALAEQAAMFTTHASSPSKSPGSMYVELRAA